MDNAVARNGVTRCDELAEYFRARGGAGVYQINRPISSPVVATERLHATSASGPL